MAFAMPVGRGKMSWGLITADPSWNARTVVVTVRRTFRVLLFGERWVEATSRAEFVPTRLLE